MKYTEALSIIEQLMPNRLEDFVKQYKNEKRKEVDYLTYTISDHLAGLVTRRGTEIKADGNAAFPKFQQQLKILSALKQRFESSLFEIKQLVQADSFDSETEESKELNKKGFHRAAGVICGVIIEIGITYTSKPFNAPNFTSFEALVLVQNPLAWRLDLTLALKSLIYIFFKSINECSTCHPVGTVNFLNYIHYSGNT